MIIYDGNNPMMGLIVAIGILLVIACVVISAVKQGKEERRMILSNNCENCKNCKYTYTVKCESGDEYIVCYNQECQEGKKEVKNNEP